ncbi:ImmA/IrrE family metallo-endopeptidase [Domibacillus sp. A3M-37]|uniref:ImmA/IrrE family metallo-endopeptidase n=1 Tax=Domibacillus sp. A3M-37 TaxID=2962037 RepID=UPI0020B84A9C|nr:ImmA/IrrE family metallo-endopeptidase [Domibacillus sp. A3M-37]MCP3763857.1 ImmA/IrrE family metallo-endopeptidase [Domibacillus sp. A3M-37]
MTYVKSHLEDFIENLYMEISITSPKQLNIKLIARRLNIEVEYSYKTSKCAEIGGIMMIRLNENLSKAEQWQEFAHELCHLLRHSGNQTLLPFPFVQLQEWQANTFALHFCIPTFMLQEIDLPFHKRLAVTQIAETFGVEYSFAEERLLLYEIQMMGIMYNSPSLL